MAAKTGGRGKRRLNKKPKGKGIGGGKWGHGFEPKNAVARQLKNKTYRAKKVKVRHRSAGRTGGNRSS